MKQIHKLTTALLTASIFAMSSAAHANLWTAGHGDLGIGYEGGELEPHWHLGEDGEVVVVNGVPQSNDPDGFEYGVDQLVAQTNKTETRLAGVDWDFVGVASGETYFIFPQTEDPTVPYLGIGTEELTLADWSSDLTLTLTGISGSGVDAGGFFSLYQVDAFNTPTASMSTLDGISGGDSWSQAAEQHTHHNWVFTELGTYNLTFQITGTHATDGAKTANATYEFNVVPEPSNAGLIMLAVSLFYVASTRRRKA